MKQEKIEGRSPSSPGTNPANFPEEDFWIVKVSWSEFSIVYEPY
jgi:hypothetical protein